MDDGANGAEHGVKVTEPLLPPARVHEDGSKRSGFSHSDGGFLEEIGMGKNAGFDMTRPLEPICLSVVVTDTDCYKIWMLSSL